MRAVGGPAWCGQSVDCKPAAGALPGHHRAGSRAEHSYACLACAQQGILFDYALTLTPFCVLSLLISSLFASVLGVPTDDRNPQPLRTAIVKDIKKFAQFFVEKNLFIKMHMICKRYVDKAAGAAFQQLARYTLLPSLCLALPR